MKIALCTIGSRGDIQPFLILGRSLSARGHQVRFSTAEMYNELIDGYGLEAFPFRGDYEKLVNDEEMKKLIGKNPLTIKKKLRQHVHPIIASSLGTFYEAVKWADVIVYHPKTLIDSFGEVYRHKLIKAYVVPAFTPTRSFVNPVLQAFPIPAFLNRLSYRITNSLLGTMKEPIRNFMRKNGLDHRFGLMDTPMIYGVSRHLIDEPADYPENHHFTGFWLEKESEGEVPREVIRFFDTNSKKLIITFGSMPYQSDIPIEKFVLAIQQNIDVKVLIVRGWGLRDAAIDEDENLMVIDKAPFDKLFPLADGVIHHGGAGTTAVAIQSGTPMFICPVLHPFGDQYFWGQKIFEAGAGVKPIPLTKLKIKKFVSSVHELLTKDYSLETNRLQELVKNEDGIANAMEVIESHQITKSSFDN